MLVLEALDDASCDHGHGEETPIRHTFFLIRQGHHHHPNIHKVLRGG